MYDEFKTLLTAQNDAEIAEIRDIMHKNLSDKMHYILEAAKISGKVLYSLEFPNNYNSYTRSLTIYIENEKDIDSDTMGEIQARMTEKFPKGTNNVRVQNIDAQYYS